MFPASILPNMNTSQHSTYVKTKLAKICWCSRLNYSAVRTTRQKHGIRIHLNVRRQCSAGVSNCFVLWWNDIGQPPRPCLRRNAPLSGLFRLGTFSWWPLVQRAHRHRRRGWFMFTWRNDATYFCLHSLVLMCWGWCCHLHLNCGPIGQVFVAGCIQTSLRLSGLIRPV